MKRTWTTVKKNYRFQKIEWNFLPKQLVLNNLEIFNQKIIVETLINIFVKLDLNMHLKYPIR